MFSSETLTPMSIMEVLCGTKHHMHLPCVAVERVMGITTSMYVRRTLPLQQAITAMKQKETKAAVVVDDNFKVSLDNPMPAHAPCAGGVGWHLFGMQGVGWHLFGMQGVGWHLFGTQSG